MEVLLFSDVVSSSINPCGCWVFAHQMLVCQRSGDRQCVLEGSFWLPFPGFVRHEKCLGSVDLGFHFGVVADKPTAPKVRVLVCKGASRVISQPSRQDKRWTLRSVSFVQILMSDFL